MSSQPQRHEKGAVRYVEKRRTGTCAFADRIARASLESYRQNVPDSHRDRGSESFQCVAAILAHFPPDGREGGANGDGLGTLQVVAMGAGTKFLAEGVLREEERLARHAEDGNERQEPRTRYGLRVRDCHAEVLARRAFRWHVSKVILSDVLGCNFVDCSYRPILERWPAKEKGRIRYGLKPGVTLHFYSSSAPCGNATLKKFQTMRKERFDDKLDEDSWPMRSHQEINAHSIHMGQFALLLKRDSSIKEVENKGERAKRQKMSMHKGKPWPAQESDDWCPPGTTIPKSNCGSVHSCSDKIARWNYLGLQGALLSPLLESPVYLSTVTIGRKMTESIGRRAICCRLEIKKRTRKKKIDALKSEDATCTIAQPYKIKHPAVMGTSVYMDEDGILDMAKHAGIGQDVRFDSNLCWAYGAGMEDADCIDGKSGFLSTAEPEDDTRASIGKPSRVSTAALTDLYVDILRAAQDEAGTGNSGAPQILDEGCPFSMEALRALKRKQSPEYESAKRRLLKDHWIFGEWCSRESMN